METTFCEKSILQDGTLKFVIKIMLCFNIYKFSRIAKTQKILIKIPKNTCDTFSANYYSHQWHKIIYIFF